jgi:EAL domain-containing protein (putative c-di-GMP-specific phosphodiesterase class I)
VSDRFLLDRILERGSLSVHFQAVLDLQSTPLQAHYLEALVRGPRGTTAEAPSILFEYARKKSKEALVDRACVEGILEAAATLPPDLLIGINVHASTLAMDGGFVDFLASALGAHGFSPRRVVIEIVEHAPPWDVVSFRAALTGLRRLGARIALDDVGLGHSNYMMICECRPDYLKIDRYFVDGCHGDFHRRAVLASVAQLARPFGARVVAEGVESVEDMVSLRRLGITLVQGFLFGQPAPAAETMANLAAQRSAIVGGARPAGRGHGPARGRHHAEARAGRR